jgi:hypothetical protein
LLAVEYGGFFLIQVARDQQPVAPFQRTFYRAGHVHAGVLVILSMVGLILADAANLGGVLGCFARAGIWVAAIFAAGRLPLLRGGAGCQSAESLCDLAVSRERFPVAWRPVARRRPPDLVAPIMRVSR